MQVSEIARQLIKKKYSTQQALADALNPMPEGIEKVKQADVQRLVNAGRNIEKQFAVFLKLLELCKAQDLETLGHDLLTNEQRRSTNKGSQPEGSAKVKKTNPRPISSGKPKGGQGR